MMMKYVSEVNEMKCPYCGSENIEKHVAWGKTVDTGCVGLRYTRGTLWTGIAQVYSGSKW